MPRYDLYRSIHKFIRWRLFRFGEELATVDFCSMLAVTDIKKVFDEIAFELRMHAAKEERYFTPLFEAKKLTVHQRVKEDHSNQEEELKQFVGLFENVLRTEDNEIRAVQGCDIISAYDVFLADNLCHFNEEETVLMSELWNLYSDEKLREVTIASYKGLPESVLLDSVNFFPVLNPFEKEIYLHDLKEACSPGTFLKVWGIAAASKNSFTDDERMKFSTKFGLPLESVEKQKDLERLQ